MTDHKKRLAIVLVVLGAFGLLFLLLSFIDPKSLVSKIGVENAYILMFLVALFGGFSSGGSVSFITLLIALVAGGVDPYILGLIGGVALTIGDTVIFLLASKGREFVRGKWDQKLDRVHTLFERKPWLHRGLPIFSWFYLGLTPMPNDLLLVFLAAIEYPKRAGILVILLGDLTFTLSLALLTATGASLL